MAGAQILGVVVGKLSYQKEFSPMILFIINKGSEVSFYCTIIPLGLAINLRVESCRKPLLNHKEIL